MPALASRGLVNKSGNRRGKGMTLLSYVLAWELCGTVEGVCEKLGVDRKSAKARLRQLDLIPSEGPGAPLRAPEPLPAAFRCSACHQIGPSPVCKCGEVINPILAAEHQARAASSPPAPDHTPDTWRAPTTRPPQSGVWP